MERTGTVFRPLQKGVYNIKTGQTYSAVTGVYTNGIRLTTQFGSSPAHGRTISSRNTSERVVFGAAPIVIPRGAREHATRGSGLA